MKTSDKGIDLIKQHEGLRLEPYQDVAGKWTVGYGHLIKIHEAFGQITEDEAEELLVIDLGQAETCINNSVKTPLSQAEFDALVSFVYNVGCQNFKNSTMLKLINRNELDDAADQFERWVYAGGEKVNGLKNRRMAERNLFLGVA